MPLTAMVTRKYLRVYSIESEYWRHEEVLNETSIGKRE